MMLKFNFVKIKLAIILITVFSIGCTPDAQDDIPLFQEYIAENINKKSDDPYISSTVKLGEPLYEFLYMLQRSRGDLSLLEPLIEEGNTDAMVWKARAESNDVNVRGETIALLGRAMKAGNPYAALALSNGGEECWDFGENSISTQLVNDLGEELPKDIETCSKDNLEVALKGFQELAEQGDLPAQYFLLQRKRRKQPDDSREAHELYIKEIIRFAESYYYTPLMDYVIPLIKRNEKTRKLEGITPEIERLVIKLLTISANHNYAPAINILIGFSKEPVDKELFKKGVMLSSSNAIKNILNMEYRRMISLSLEEKVYYLEVFHIITGKRSIHDDIDENEGVRERVMPKVMKTVSQMTPMVYIDGFTRKSEWGEN